MWRRAENAHQRRAFPVRPSSLSFSGRGGRPISGLSLCGKKSRSWRPKRCSAEKLRLEAVAARPALRLKPGNAQTGIRAAPDQAAQTAATIRPAHHASWRRRADGNSLFDLGATSEFSFPGESRTRFTPPTIAHLNEAAKSADLPAMQATKLNAGPPGCSALTCP
jgi:hypothetical protein